MLNKIIKLLKILSEDGLQGFVRILKYKLQALSPSWETKKIVKIYSPSTVELSNLKLKLGQLSYQPRISIILPVYNPPISFLKECVDSVRAQVYQNWELCIADDASTNQEIPDYLLTLPSQDARIKVTIRNENGHISNASNSALELASGEFVALLDHDDILSRSALAEVVLFLNSNPKADLIYSNEDKVDLKGRRSQPTFKACWSPDYFLSFMYIGHLSVYRKSLVDRVKGFRVGYEGSQDYDLALRVTELTKEIYHLPKFLYHWRMHPESVAVNLSAKPYAFTSAKKALSDAMKRRGVEQVDFQDTKFSGIYKCVIKNNPINKYLLVSTDPHANIVDPNFEVINPSDDLAGVFLRNNHHEIVNHSHLLYLERGVKIATPDIFFSELSNELSRPAVGLISPRIENKNGDILSAGASLANNCIYNNFYGVAKNSFGYGARIVVPYNTSIACPSAWSVSIPQLLKYLPVLFEYKSWLFVMLALSFELQKEGCNNLYSPYLVCNADKIEPNIKMIECHDDWQILNERYKLDNYKDPYYPIGLRTDPLDFRVSM